MKEQNEYILGTDTQELHRLGVQHQVWAEEAQKGWRLAGFTEGQTVLDLGSGPGFCSRELAYIVGESGTIIAVDKSEHFIAYLNEISGLSNLSIDARCTDFNEMELEANSLDGMFCRWALAWLPNPAEILEKVYHALKPGGKMVIHEYYDWSTHQTEPRMQYLSVAIKAALKSFKESEGEIDIGRHLPSILLRMNMKLESLRLMPKLAVPDNFVWQWPRTFYNSYFPKLVEMNLLSESEMKAALNDLHALERYPGATLHCPMMIEVIAIK